MKGKGNRRKEVNDGFTFPALIQKIRVIPNDFFTPQAESFWFTASLSHFEKPGHFQSLSQNTVRRKSESETEWILLEVWNDWVMYCTANGWLRRSSHCLQLCASHLSHCQSFSHFLTGRPPIKFLSHCKMLQSIWFGPSHWVIFTPLRRSHWSSDWNCECDPNHWLQCLAGIITQATSQTGQNPLFF